MQQIFHFRKYTEIIFKQQLYTIQKEINNEEVYIHGTCFLLYDSNRTTEYKRPSRLTSLYFIYNYILLFLLFLNMKKKSVLILPLLLPIVSMGIVGCSNDDDVNAPQISVMDNLVSFTPLWMQVFFW